MGAFIVYIIKSSLLLAMLVSLFMLFMSRETFHRLNRWLLLFVVMLSLVLPLVNVGVSTPLQGLFTAIENSFIYDDGQAHGVGVVVDETFDITQFPASNGDVLPMTDDVPIAETITPVADKKENEEHRGGRRFALFGIAFLFFMAELGDKTQLSVIALSAQNPSMKVWIFLGAVIGMLLADGIGDTIRVSLTDNVVEEVKAAR